MEDAILLQTYNNKRVGEWIVFNNGHAILTKLTKNFSLDEYSFDKLVTSTKDRMFNKKDYYSYAIFNKKGKMIDFKVGNK